MPLVAAVIASAEEELQIKLRKAPGGFGDGQGGGSCGDAMGRPVTAGWPEVYTYDLNESFDRDIGTTLVELGGDRIYWKTLQRERWMGFLRRRRAAECNHKSSPASFLDGDVSE